MKNKLHNISEILKKIDHKKKVVFVYGNFNVLHPGHIRFLKFASENGDLLVVGINKDSENTHIELTQRYSTVSAISIVDHVFVINEFNYDLNELKPDVIVMGSENESKKDYFIESYISKNKARLVYSSGQSFISSYDFLKKEFLNSVRNTFDLPLDFIERKKIDNFNLINIIDRFSKVRVCVLGDLIVDEYITCDPVGMSQEDPTIVLRPNIFERFIGGAGIVSAHAKSLGSDVNFISITGNDEIRNYVIDKIRKLNISADLLIDDSRLTTFKQKFRSRGKTLLRVNSFRDHHLSKDLAANVLKRFKKIANNGLDLVVFSDFNYGFLTQELVNKITKICHTHQIKIVADSQSSSQVGDISRFKNVFLITPTEYEIRLALKDFESGLVELARKMIKKTNSENIFITLGHDGVFIFNKDGIVSSSGTDQIQALNNQPRDVSGAGDSLLIVSSLALSVGANIWEAAYLGSVAAAIQVSRVGNKPLNTIDIINVLDS